MNEHVRDRIVGAILIAFAAVWCGTVWMTVPNSYSGSLVGPRDAPFWLGIGLALLALALIGTSYLAESAGGGEGKNQPSAPTRKNDRRSEWLAVGVVGGSLIAYALLMEWFGFVIATIVVLIGLLRVALGVRSLPLILGMSLCTSFGVYFVMGWLMGVYLPRGTIISLF